MGVESWSMPFVADLIDLPEFDDIFDSMTSGQGIGDVHHKIAPEIGYLHEQYRKPTTKAPVAPKEAPTSVRISDPRGKIGSPQPPFDKKGRPLSIAATILMISMCQARIARFDVQKLINCMANRISCWGVIPVY